MNYLLLLLAFSAAQILLGLYIARRVTGAKDFFVAGRALGPGLIFSTLLAANIGAGSTVGAAGLGYRDGLSAWWWVGSAGIGSLVLALLDRPAHPTRRRGARPAHGRRLPRVALRRRVRADRSRSLLWFGIARSFSPASWSRISKLHPRRRSRHGRAVGRLRDRRRGDDHLLHRRRPAQRRPGSTSCSSSVKMLGLLRSRCRSRSRAVGGLVGAARRRRRQPDYWNFWQGGSSGWIYLAMLGARLHRLARAAAEDLRRARRPRGAARRRPERARPARSMRSCRCCSGMSRARAASRTWPIRDLALPTMLMHGLPPLVGALGLAARVLRRGERRRRRALHADDVALAGSLQAIRQPDGHRRARAAGGAPDRGGRAASLGIGLAHRLAVGHRRADDLLHLAQRQPVRADPRRTLRPARRHARSAGVDRRRRRGDRRGGAASRRGGRRWSA